MKKSVWTDNFALKERDKLQGDVKTDVLIIGGGICGLLCAYVLHNEGVEYILAEADKTASGITKNTTAKITSQHGLIYSRILTDYGKEKAAMYLKANEDAIKRYEDIAKNIDCHFEKKDAYTYSTKSRSIIEREVRVVNDLGFDAEFTDKTELPFEIKGAIRFARQAQFNPMEFVKGISEKCNIYENTFVKRIEENTAFTDEAKICAEKIIITTHFPFINSHGAYFMKLYQHRSYVTAFENAQTIDAMYVDEDKNSMSFRMYENLLLVGGGGHRTGKTGGNLKEIGDFAKKHYPSAIPAYQWATQDAMSLDGIPYIGMYSKHTPHLYVATGFNKWGMTSSMVAAQMLCEMVLGKKSEYEELFNPQRRLKKSNLLINGFETAINFLSPMPRRCPHLGCALKWNKYEHTWDCPCHGSRFTREGDLIDNPAMKKLH